MADLLLLFPLPFESAAFRRSACYRRNQARIQLGHGGMGPARFGHFLDHLSSLSPRVILAGFCGGLHPEATVGSLFLAEVRLEKSRLSNILRGPAGKGAPHSAETVVAPPPASISGQLFPPPGAKLTPFAGDLVSSSLLVGTSGQKKALRQKSPHAVVVDMETGFALCPLQKVLDNHSGLHHLEIQVVRAVSDGPEEGFPVPPHLLISPQGEPPHWSVLVRHLLIHPRQLPGLLRLMRNSLNARRILTRQLIARVDTILQKNV